MFRDDYWVAGSDWGGKYRGCSFLQGYGCGTVNEEGLLFLESKFGELSSS
jgi:hypothetical protein